MENFDAEIRIAWPKIAEGTHFDLNEFTNYVRLEL